MAPNPELLTTAQVAALCNVTKATVNRWATDGRIPVITLPSGMRRFRREDVNKLLTPTGGDPSADDAAPRATA